MPKPVAETRARVNAHARETDTQFMEQLRNFRRQRAPRNGGRPTLRAAEFCLRRETGRGIGSQLLSLRQPVRLVGVPGEPGAD